MTTTTKQFVTFGNQIEEVCVVTLNATTGYVTRLSGLMGYYGPGYPYETAKAVIEAYRKLQKKL